MIPLLRMRKIVVSLVALSLFVAAPATAATVPMEQGQMTMPSVR